MKDYFQETNVSHWIDGKGWTKSKYLDGQKGPSRPKKPTKASRLRSRCIVMDQIRPNKVDSCSVHSKVMTKDILTLNAKEFREGTYVRKGPAGLKTAH